MNPIRTFNSWLALGLVTSLSAQIPERVIKSEPTDLQQVIDWGDDSGFPLPFSGTRKDPKTGKVQHELNILDLGIDHFENGVKTENLWEKWVLKIQDPSISTNNSGIWASLDRLVFMKAEDPLGADIFPYSYSTSDGTLNVTFADWKQGIIKLLVGAEWDNPITCTIKFHQVDSDLPGLPMASLESVYGVVNITTILGKKKIKIEYRATDHTYVLALPVILHGLKTAGEKRWDDLVTTLSPADQTAWVKLRIRKDKFTGPTDREVADFIRGTHPDMAKDLDAGRAPKGPESEAILGAAYAALWSTHIERFFAGSELSPAGQAILVDYLSKALLKNGTRTPH